MQKDVMIRGYYRLNKMLIDLINCEDKQEIIRLSNCFIDDAQELIALIYVENSMGDEDIEEFKKELVNIEEVAMVDLNDGEEKKNIIKEEESPNASSEPQVEAVRQT